MLEPKSNAPASSLGVHDILTILFKHKWKIIVCSVIGIIGAAAVFSTFPPIYESEAKVFVRYIVERSALDPVESATGAAKTGESKISTEVDILTSADLAGDVAAQVGPEKLLPNSKIPPTQAAAAMAIGKGLTVNPRKGSDVIIVDYRNKDPQLATLVLEKLIAAYQIRHRDIHRPPEIFDIVTKQSDEIKQRLRDIEDQLKQAMSTVSDTGTLSRTESITVLTAELAKSREELNMAEAELAEQDARVKQMEKTFGGTVTKEAEAGDPAPTRPQITDQETQTYQTLVARIAQLRQAEFGLLTKYTPENQLVRLNQAEIAELDRQRRDLEKKYPGIAATAPIKDAGPGHTTDIVTEVTRLAGLIAKVETLKTRFGVVQTEYKKFANIAPEIAQLERKKELEEANLKYVGSTLEKTRADQSLDPAKMPNLSIVQKPTMAAMATSAREKIVMGLAGGGLGLGLGLALLIELVLDRSIKRPLELESRLRIPLMLTIPEISRKSPRRLRQSKEDRKSLPALQNGSRSDSLPWEVSHFIRPFSEAIRDRLVLFFKLNEMTHKPKMVAVTGFSGGEGTSTVAGGLAAVLSEMGDGKVLLVDMNGGEAAIHPFFDGNPVRSVSDVLQGGSPSPSANENLVLATASSAGNGATRMIPKKFYNLVPHFKASDFDYIIFDMPPLDQSSATLAMAGSMDKVLVVIEAEKSNGDMVQRACSELVAAKANVSGILNKTRSYAPKWLQG